MNREFFLSLTDKIRENTDSNFSAAPASVGVIAAKNDYIPQTHATTPIGQDGWAIFALVLCCFLIALSIGSSLLHKVLMYYYVAPGEVADYEILKDDYSDDIDDNSYIQGEDDDDDAFILNEDSEPMIDNIPSRFMSHVIDLSLCLSMHHNYRRLTSRKGNSKINSLNGIRVLSILWVILGHTLFYHMKYPYSNQIALFFWMQKTSTQLITNAFFSVDTFLFLSGFLAFYVLAEKIHVDKFGLLSYLKIVFHRYLRITPTYLIIMVTWYLLSPYLLEGPYADEGLQYTGMCDKMWVNLLYLANFNIVDKIDSGISCLPHSWYLNCDFQFFLLVPILVFITKKHKAMGMVLILSLLLIHWIVTMVFEINFKLSAFTVNAFISMHSNSNDKDFFASYYDKPYFRYGPYGIGMLVAFVFKYYSNVAVKKWRTRFGAFLIYLVSFGVLLFLVLESAREFYPEKIPGRVETILYFTFARSLWGLGVGIFVYGCGISCGGLINKFLSANIWTVPARLGLAVYLIHPQVIIYFYYNRQYPDEFSARNLFFDFFSVCVVSYALAFIVSLLVEAPISSIEKHFLKRFMKI